MTHNDWTTAALNISFRRNSNPSINSQSGDLHSLEQPIYDPGHSHELIYAQPNKPKNLFRPEGECSETSIYKEICSKLQPSTNPFQRSSPFSDPLLSIKKTNSNGTRNPAPYPFNRTTHPFDDNIAHLLNLQNSFCNDDDFELSPDPKLSLLYRHLSIITNKNEDHERQIQTKTAPVFKGFDRLGNFLIKFYKCHPILKEDHDFSQEDISILKSFTKRKYRKKIEPE